MSDSFCGQTVESARRLLIRRFKSEQIDTAELDARMLVGAALDLDLTGLIAAAGRLLTPDEAIRIEKLGRRRLGGEPVARILGYKEFWGLNFQLCAATLVPRPDTETVVELAWQAVCRSRLPHRSLRILDIGTGSGAILLALLSELPNASGIGTDISAAATEAAHANSVRLGFAPRTAFVACNYATALAGKFDLIVSNPPYIRSTEISDLAIEVRDHDPLAALDGGADGLDAYRAIAPEAVRLLAPGGLLVVELGLGQSGDVGRLMKSVGLALQGPPKEDLSGIRRAVAFQKLP